MKKVYYIYKLFHSGNIEPNEIEKIDNQPATGFINEGFAKDWLKEMFKGGVDYGYNYTILPIYKRK